MSTLKITVLGGTGYAGSAIAREAVARGHAVTSVSRSLPADDARIEGVDYRTGTMTDPDSRRSSVVGADVVISALFPRGELAGNLAEVDAELARAAAAAGARFGVVGGFSALRTEPGGPRMAEQGDLGMPPEFVAVVKEMMAVLQKLETLEPGIDWFYASPAAQFGSHVPGEARGEYRVGGDVALFDAEGVSAISGADYASAVLDEIEQPRVHRAEFGVAY
ncbi:NAD(P)-dependent oxidoreductase [Herbiconiux liangxiaofengii]|uniref:NAD(P)-dependent oxidoreductase n=1 Tax=Herbiconiux liangxiaofengii TaxID=3342795 RepID=UPI0035B7CF1C